jgi:hypothetical protein
VGIKNRAKQKLNVHSDPWQDYYLGWYAVAELEKKSRAGRAKETQQKLFWNTPFH